MSFSRDGLGFQKKKRNRGIGDAPSMGNVPRMHKNALGLGVIRSYAGRIPKVLLVLALLIFAAGISGLVLWASRGRGAANPVAVSAAPGPSAAPRVPLVPVPEPAVLEKTVTDFLAARTTAALIPLIRGTVQKPDRILDKLTRLEARDGKLHSVRYLRSIESRCLQLEAVVVTFNTGRNRIALLSPDSENRWRVDFDAFDRLVAPDWESLLSGDSVEGTVRIYISADTYYNGHYIDDRQWACFSLASPDHETLMFGYAKRGSIQHRALAATLRESMADGALQRMTLDVRHSGTGNKRQFEIIRVLADDWSLGNEPLEALLEK